ncbi:MAG TPA: Rieske 2Fe-2S domain-containing protein [Chloroflexota bacterium]
MMTQSTQNALNGNGHAEADWTDFVHTGPGTIAGAYLRRFWQPVFRSQDLKPGKAVPIKVMSEDLTLYRGESGATHALPFRCAHRGTQLSTGWVEGDNLRCRYHGWTYNASGQCVQQPCEPTPFAEKVRLRAYPTQEYLGFVFLYMGEGQAPPLPRYPQMETEGELDVSSGVRGCNYFTNVENAVDELHHYFVHWQRRTPVGDQVIPRMNAEETDYGFRIILNQPGDDRVWTWHWHMPNILQMNTSDFDQALHWRVPIDDESHLIPTCTRIQPGASVRGGEGGAQADPTEHSKMVAEISQKIRSGRMTVEDVDLRAGAYFPVGDDVTQLGQGAIPDRASERLGASDVGIIMLRNLWKRDLRALSEGQPTKEWQHSVEGLIATPRLYARGTV